jgi:hypothetical protein
MHKSVRNAAQPPKPRPKPPPPRPPRPPAPPPQPGMNPAALSVDKQPACFVVREDDPGQNEAGREKEAFDFCCDAAVVKRSLWVHF